METTQPGKILFVTGLYCAGKTTLIGEALARIPELQYITTYTTREPRLNELRDGTHEYEFVSQSEYDRLRQTRGWGHTKLRGVSYGADAAGVRRQAAKGRPFIVVTPMNPDQIRPMFGSYGGRPVLVFLDVDFETCRRRILAPGSDRSEKYLQDPTQTPEQAARIRRMADYVYEPLGPLEADKIAFTEFVRRIIGANGDS